MLGLKVIPSPVDVQTLDFVIDCNIKLSFLSSFISYDNLTFLEFNKISFHLVFHLQYGKLVHCSRDINS